MSKSDLPVLVIGAGTGGLALANGLRNAGIPVEIYERDRHRGLLTGNLRRGLSMIFDRRSTFSILHVMEFPWQRGIGDTDAELIVDNTTDYFSWGVSASRQVLLPAERSNGALDAAHS